MTGTNGGVAPQMQVVALGKTATVTVDANGNATTIVQALPITDIRGDGGTQSRTSLSEATVDEYADLVRAGVAMPPVVVFDDGAEIWLGDGFHRFHAHRAAEAAEILCEVRFGTRRDAILFSVGANASHGLRRTNEDKRRAVMTLLNDPEWATWTQARIAEVCCVSREFVSRLSTAQSPSCDRSQDAVRVVERNGKTYEQNTANIGKASMARAGAQSDQKTAETRMNAGFEGGAEGGQASTIAKPLIANGSASDSTAISAGKWPGPTDVVDPDTYGPSPEEIAAAIRAEAEQLEYIKNLLASDDDPLALALADLKQKCLEISALRSQNAGHQNTINDQIRMIKSLRSKLDKLERPV